MQEHPFIETLAPNPHAARRKAIRAAHPEVRDLQGHSAWTAVLAAALTLLQVGVAWGVEVLALAWWWLVLLAWVLGAFVAHALFAVMHEASHRLVFGDPRLDRVVLVLANVTLALPFAVPFAHFHLLHHRAQGCLGEDPDLPSFWEARVFGGVRGKFVWHLLFPFLQLLRVGDPDAKDGGGSMWRDGWWLVNLATQVGVLTALAWWCPRGLVYLLASLAFVFVLHPLVGRFVQEHHVFVGEQETSSYYGPLNALCLNFGHHTEHHDFPAVPWHRLPKLRRLAPEAYGPPRHHHRSWTALWLRLVFDPTLKITDRVVRRRPSG